MVCRSFSGSIAAGSHRGAAAAGGAPPAVPAPNSAAPSSSPSAGAAGVRGALAASAASARWRCRRSVSSWRDPQSAVASLCGKSPAAGKVPSG
eukprot:2963311-Pyramimonas_sp.AAC.1